MLCLLLTAAELPTDVGVPAYSTRAQHAGEAGEPAV
jgi:hypothetical protein